MTPRAMVVEPTCAECGERVSFLELIPPDALPHDFDNWKPKYQELFREYRKPENWQMLFSSLGGGNGVVGDGISEDRAALLCEALAPPLTYEGVKTADFFDDMGFCSECEVPYCCTHWHVSTSGYGTCPKGHGRSLDPHWSP